MNINIRRNIADLLLALILVDILTCFDVSVFQFSPMKRIAAIHWKLAVQFAFVVLKLYVVLHGSRLMELSVLVSLI